MNRKHSTILLCIASFFILLIAFSFQRVPEKKNTGTTIVIFGATGDLFARKVMPALYQLWCEGSLSGDTSIIAIGRRPFTDESFRALMRQSIKNPQDWSKFENRLTYHSLQFDRGEDYTSLQDSLKKVDGNRLYFLATPPSYFSTIIKELDVHGMITPPNAHNWTRVVIEKPFGQDLASAIQLQSEIRNHLAPSQIFCIDHYLGKQGVQDIFTLRKTNNGFSSVLNQGVIDSVEIHIDEQIGIGTRANFWEETGYLRDIFQNHMMQLLALIAMEPPVTPSADDLKAAKIEALNQIRLYSPHEIDDYIVRGQYGPGTVEGKNVPGYRQEKGVPANSTVETYVAATLFIDNSRWQGVPFRLRGGKRLPDQSVEILLHFKKDVWPYPVADTLALIIQPTPAFAFLKDGRIVNVMALSSSNRDAYETLLEEAISGRADLFVDTAEQIAAWKILTPILEHWKNQSPPDFPNYPAGSPGPKPLLY